MLVSEYKSRYKKGKIRRKFCQYNDQFKRWVLLTVTRIDWLVRKFKIFDHYTLRHNMEIRFENEKELRIPYTDITLNQFHFYDVIDIDSINSKTVNKFRRLVKQKKKNGFDDNKDPLGYYQSFKNQMGYIVTGGLITLSYKDIRKTSNDYLGFVSISFIKTMESFVIIRVTVTPSEMFQLRFNEILSADLNSMGIVNYKSWWQVLTKLRFIQNLSMGTNSLSRGLDNLFYDVQYQVNKNVLEYLNGTFSQYKVLQKIPYMSYFEVKDLEEFHKDKILGTLFPKSFDGPFMSALRNTEVYLTELDDQNRNNIRVVRQIPTNTTPEEDKKFRQDIDHHFMLESFAFPCAFRAILKLQISRLNQMKRDIYDFTEYISNRRSFNPFAFFLINTKYIRLKIRMTKFVTSMKRIESEFSLKELLRYIDEENLLEFKATRPRKERENLLALYMSEADYLSKSYNANIKGIQEVFKSVEELNTFRTNFALQIFSAFVALMAFFAAFESVKKFFSWLWTKSS